MLKTAIAYTMTGERYLRVYLTRDDVKMLQPWDRQMWHFHTMATSSMICTCCLTQLQASIHEKKRKCSLWTYSSCLVCQLDMHVALLSHQGVRALDKIS